MGEEILRDGFLHFAVAHILELAETYVDNGFSGTNFERPAFLRMLEDIRKGKIRCVVVKDLSRFGRNYLEAGYCIETVFPFLDVRLLAVTDHFDSCRKEDKESLSVPIHDMVSTWKTNVGTDIREVDRELVRELVKEIWVSAHGSIELVFRFEDEWEDFFSEQETDEREERDT